MDDLITRVMQASGLDANVSRQAVAAILAFLRKEADGDAATALFAAMPGAHELVGSMAGASAGGGVLGALGGMMGGGLMGLAGKLTSLGLGMGEMQSVGREVLAYGREKAGEDVVKRVADSVPGLSQLM